MPGIKGGDLFESDDRVLLLVTMSMQRTKMTTREGCGVNQGSHARRERGRDQVSAFVQLGVEERAVCVGFQAVL